jgi:hypothetical protein
VIAETLTPRGVIERLERVKGMSGAGSDALARIRDAVEREGYGRPPAGGAEPFTPKPELADDLSQVLSRLSASVDSSTRTRATLLPASLVRRARRAVAKFA